MWQGEFPKAGKLTLEIPGGPVISYTVKATSFGWTSSSEPAYYELGRMSAVAGKPIGILELSLVGVGVVP